MVLGSLFRHALEADSVPRLGGSIEVAKIWATSTEPRELDIQRQKTWVPTIRGNI